MTFSESYVPSMGNELLKANNKWARLNTKEKNAKDLTQKVKLNNEKSFKNQLLGILKNELQVSFK